MDSLSPTWTYEGKTWEKSTDYSSMDNSTIEKFLKDLKDTEGVDPKNALKATGLQDGWVPLVCPDE